MPLPSEPVTPISVLHVGKFYPPASGGMERVVQLLCEVERRAVDSHVLVVNHGLRTRRERWRGVPVTRVGRVGMIGSVGICPSFPLELWRARRDVTVIHEPNPLALVSDWVSVQRGPLVIWFHSEVHRPRWKYRLLYRPFLRRALNRATRIVVSSPELLEHAAELQDFRHKSVVIPFGIDTSLLDRTPDVERRIAHIERHFPGPRLLFVGRLVPYKGVDVLVRAMHDVRATALIVGDGPLRATLAQAAEREGVAASVRFLGRLSDEDVVAHLHACDALVLPSVTRQETFGVVQLEAMACGKPVVSTDLPTGVRWVNRSGETGLVVEPGNARALASALNLLLSDPSLRASLGVTARRRVAAEFTASRMVSQAQALFHEALEDTRAVTRSGDVAAPRPSSISSREMNIR